MQNYPLISKCTLSSTVPVHIHVGHNAKNDSDQLVVTVHELTIWASFALTGNTMMAMAVVDFVWSGRISPPLAERTRVSMRAHNQQQ